MSNRRKKIIEKILPTHDDVVLYFNEHDAEIARNWRYPLKAKSRIEGPLPIAL